MEYHYNEKAINDYEKAVMEFVKGKLDIVENHDLDLNQLSWLKNAEVFKTEDGEYDMPFYDYDDFINYYTRIEFML